MKKISPEVTDYLIIGGGLAGCVLAWTLLRRGIRCRLVDTPLLSNASRISAGIINPISGKRFSLLWDADRVISKAQSVYAALEEQFRQSFLRSLPTLRLFTDQEEHDVWFAKRSQTITFADYVPHEQVSQRFSQDFGGISYTAWHVDVEAVVMRLRAWLRDEGCLVEEEFIEENLHFASNEVLYAAHDKHIHAKRVAMCNGWKALHSALWRDLPLSPAKGELLTVRAEAPPLQELVVKNVFLLPLGHTIMRIGASYSWEHLDETPTPETAQILLAKAQEVFPVPMTILRHDAGVRPAAQDSKPILGVHPSETRCAIMNGFGSKGAAYTPFCAESLVDFLESGTPLAEWCALTRWKAWR
jgi:glycine oxidase